jgi:predicted dehydrogenase
MNENMSRKLKVGVVGAGVFGTYHARKCAAHPRTDYIGTYDTSLSRAQAVAAPLGGAGFARYARLLADCDAIIIASPATGHGPAALRALKAGCHTLIEKPIAITRRQAQRCIDTAAHRSLALQIGHQERFVAKAIGLDRLSERPIRIEARRNSPYSPRGTDVSVTLDLMTHDLDLVLWLIGESAASLSAQTICVRSKSADAALAHIKFEGGACARLSASRVEAASERVMTLTYPSGTVRLDFNAKTLSQTAGFELDENFGESPMAADSLGAAMDSFVAAAFGEMPVPISGEDGLAALDLALRIDSLE